MSPNNLSEGVRNFNHEIFLRLIGLENFDKIGMPNYIYISSRIRCLENQLLQRKDFDELTKAASLEEFIKLIETKGKSQIKDLEDYLKKERLELKKLLKKYLPDKNFLKILFLEEEFTKLKLLLKEKLKGNEKIPKNINITQKIMAEIKKHPDPFLIDLYLDKLYFETLRKLAQKISNKFVKNFLTKVIDLANLKIFLRTRLLKDSKKNFRDLFIPGGKIDLKNFGDLKEKKLDTLEEKFEDWLGEKSKYTPYGEEVVLSYWLSKNRNLDKIRFLATQITI